MQNTYICYFGILVLGVGEFIAKSIAFLRSLRRLFLTSHESPSVCKIIIPRPIHLGKDEINCFGNYALIGEEANSSCSKGTPKTKMDHYLDSSGKIKLVSVASIKFMIMMQTCKDNEHRRNQEWIFEDIRRHQEKMLVFLLPHGSLATI